MSGQEASFTGAASRQEQWAVHGPGTPPPDPRPACPAHRSITLIVWLLSLRMVMSSAAGEGHAVGVR